MLLADCITASLPASLAALVASLTLPLDTLKNRFQPLNNHLHNLVLYPSISFLVQQVVVSQEDLFLIMSQVDCTAMEAHWVVRRRGSHIS
jgi:hypothetical protein